MRARAVVVALIVIGCARSSARLAKPPPTAIDIERGALPYHVLDARTGREVDREALWVALASARAVCVGEEHPNPHHHWVQLEVVRQLASRRAPGAPFALALEMVQRPFQGVLDDFASGRIDAAALQARTGWKERWGYDYRLYGPILDAAVRGGATLIAANAPRELTKKIARRGLDSLAADDRAQVPELVLDDAQHRAWFEDLMNDMGGAEGHRTHPPQGKPAPVSDRDAPEPTSMPSAENIYTVQVLWDETMADATARWLAANPEGRAVILAGSGHCHDSGIVRRLARRVGAPVVSILPVIASGDAVASELAAPIHDYLFVLTR